MYQEGTTPERIAGEEEAVGGALRGDYDSYKYRGGLKYPCKGASPMIEVSSYVVVSESISTRRDQQGDGEDDLWREDLTVPRRHRTNEAGHRRSPIP